MKKIIIILIIFAAGLAAYQVSQKKVPPAPQETPKPASPSPSASPGASPSTSPAPGKDAQKPAETAKPALKPPADNDPARLAQKLAVVQEELKIMSVANPASVQEKALRMPPFEIDFLSLLNEKQTFDYNDQKWKDLIGDTGRVIILPKEGNVRMFLVDTGDLYGGALPLVSFLQTSVNGKVIAQNIGNDPRTVTFYSLLDERTLSIYGKKRVSPFQAFVEFYTLSDAGWQRIGLNSSNVRLPAQKGELVLDSSYSVIRAYTAKDVQPGGTGVLFDALTKTFTFSTNSPADELKFEFRNGVVQPK